MTTVTIIFTNGWEEIHEIKKEKTIKFTRPDGSNIRIIKITNTNG